MKLYITDISCAKNVPADYCRRHFPLRYQKALHFKDEKARLLSVTAGILLWEVSGIREDEIRYTDSGKPYIPGGPHFSLSHSGDYALLAVGSSPLGADLEKTDPKHLSVMKRVFTPEEIAFVGDDPERFTRLWTLKEGLSKAIGLGLFMDFRAVSVLPALEEKPILYDGVPYCGFSRLLFDGSYALAALSEEKEAPEILPYSPEF